MNIDKLKQILSKYPSFREKQVKRHLYKELVTDWDASTVLPKELKEELKKEVPLDIKAETTSSSDTQKATISLIDGLVSETVVMRHKDKRSTVCVSSQVGCSLGCKFCATGQMGLKRNLTSGEIVEQVLFFARKEKVTNIVFMGMGEPFLNYDNVIEAIRILNDPQGFNLGARSFSISTAGIIEGIEKLSRENLQINLAISLHAPNNTIRSKLMPVNKKYPLEKLMEAVEEYIQKTKRQVMFEYILIKGVNDSEENAKELSGIMKNHLYFVNLISYNPTGTFKPSTNIKKFKQILEERGVKVSQRYSFGQDIKSACGQLTTRTKAQKADPHASL